MNKNHNKLQIRNSTAEFLVFTKQNGEDDIEVRVQNGNVWLTQKAMAALFDVPIIADSVIKESSVAAALAKQHAENEFEIAGQARNPIQDRLFESDFDRVVKMIENKNE
ncbi:MAG: hypothetical protein LBN93_12225 [Candidatus Symbiothrix sp.]|jgi:hypothetical protein|nr:hypothetical protein [Candidatus Symbiothrix sp.]